MENKEFSNRRWDESSRFRIFIHLLAGFCLLATVDNSGLTKLISQSLNFTQQEITAPIISMIIASIAVVAGYFISIKITSAIDKSGLKEGYKSLVIFSLPIFYFSIVFPLVSVIQALVNAAILK